MEQAKQFILKYFEEILVTVIFVTAFVGTYLIEEVSLILNFYYLPVLVASYLLGRRKGILVAVLSIVNVLICSMLFPQRFFEWSQSLEQHRQALILDGLLTSGQCYRWNPL